MKTLRILPPKEPGFLLVDTLAALMLLSVVLFLGVPPLSRLLTHDRIQSEINDFVTYLHLARSEAVKRRYQAILCPSSDGDTCRGSDAWAQGYMVFIDKDEDHHHDADEPVVRSRGASDRVEIDAGVRRTITYKTSGWAPGSNSTITFCDPAGLIDPKAVVVSMTGRSRVTDIHPNGSELSCD